MTSIPDILACRSLILSPKFQEQVDPRSGREGEKCRPIDRVRHIPFIPMLCSYPALRSIFIICVYVQNYSRHSFHVLFTCAMEHCTIVIYTCAIPYFKDQRHFEAIFLSMYVVRINTRYSETLPLNLDTDAAQQSVGAMDVRVNEGKWC